MLPTPLAWIRKVLTILKSNLSPSQIALGFALGVFAGLPPMGLHILIPCSLALLTRCSFRSFLIAMGLFKLLSLAIAPGAFAVGRWLLDGSRGLDAFWRWLFHLPVLAPMGYGRYLLLGSLVIALALAVPVFLLVRRLVIRYRVSFTEWVGGWKASKWLKGRRGVGLARRFLAGGEAKYETKRPPRGPFRFVRREMLIALPIAYGLCYLLAAWIVPLFAGTLATSTASWVVGSEVAAEESRFNLFTGGLTLTGLTIQDPDEPTENLIEIPTLTLDAGMLPLLSKRVVFNRVAIADASLHVVREEDGTLNVDNAASSWDASGYIEWAAQYADKVDWLGLLRRLIEVLDGWWPPAPREDPLARYRGGRSFDAFQPPFAIERLEIGRILITLQDDFADDAGPLPPVTLLEVEVGNLAFPADLRTGPVVLGLHGQWGDDPDAGFRVTAVFSNGDAGPVQEFEFAMTRIDLPRIAAFYATTLPVRIVSGLATISGSVRLDGDDASGSLSFLLEEFELAPGRDRPLFGLSPAMSARVIEGINRYGRELPIVFASSIGGTSDAPTLAWEASLLEIAREGLLMLGRRELDSAIDQLGLRIDGLGGAGGIPIDPSLETVQEQAAEAARGIIEGAIESAIPDLPFGTESADTESAAADDATEAASDPLTSLFHDLIETQIDALRDDGQTPSETLDR